ncbi:MAG: antibiotic biosynthesis monooxygenase [Actinomycetota bacterium]
MSKVTMAGTFKCQDGKNDEMDAALQAMVAEVGKAEGVEFYSYSKGEGNEYSFFALFTTMDAVQGHGQGEAMEAAHQQFMSLLDGPPSAGMNSPVAVYVAG